MSDTRFTLAGIVLIFVGFIVLGVFGGSFTASTLEQMEFGECYEYFDDRPPVAIDCDVITQNKILFFALVVGLIGAGIVALIKGIRGKWDQSVRPEDMVGPGDPRDNRS